MEKLAKKYQDKLNAIKEAIQNSDLLANYLEEEGDLEYEAVKEEFEPQIEELYNQMAEASPLQILSFEEALLDDGFEGLFLPRILGYAVMRGEVNDQYKYVRPEDHFQDIITLISNSPNFDQIRKRIGKTAQIGFAMSSDIWITNLIASIDNKKVQHYLNTLKLPIYRDLKHRKSAYIKYKRQFRNFNYLYSHFPKTAFELEQYKNTLIEFLLFRAASDFDNSSIFKHMGEIINNKELHNTLELADVLVVIGMFYDLPDKQKKDFTKVLNTMRKKPGFDDEVFDFGIYLLNNHYYSSKADMRFSNLIDKSIKDELSEHFSMIEILHTKGFVHKDSIAAVQKYYNLHPGLSNENECVRLVISDYFERFLDNLGEEEFSEYFEMNKIFTQYINIFNNEHFSLEVKTIILRYIKRLIKKFTDKRGRDYQDIKKFVRASFLDLGFMKEKQLVALFKTKRKKKVVSE